MEFNKVVRGAKRAANTEESVYQVLDAGFLCHVAFQHNGQTMMIPTAYGRKGDHIYLHGSSKNMMLNQLLNGQTACISVTHLDGIVLARNLFHSSVNYRSVVLFGKAENITGTEEKLEAFKIITENITPGRWEEVPVGSQQDVDVTMVIRFTIDMASAKIRSGGPQGDENEPEVWSGHIPLELKAREPVTDTKFNKHIAVSESAANYWKKHR